MVKQGNLVIPSIFAVIPLLRGNSDALNQSNPRNFSAYINIAVIPLLNGNRNAINESNLRDLSGYVIKAVIVIFPKEDSHMVTVQGRFGFITYA